MTKFKVLKVVEDGVWLRIVTDYAARPEFVFLASKFRGLGEVEVEIAKSIERAEQRALRFAVKSNNFKEDAFNAGYEFSKRVEQ